MLNCWPALIVNQRFVRCGWRWSAQVRKAINGSSSHLSRGFTLQVYECFFFFFLCLPRFSSACDSAFSFLSRVLDTRVDACTYPLFICLANQRPGPLSCTYLVNDFSFSLRSRDHQLIEVLMDGPFNLYVCTSVCVSELTPPTGHNTDNE